MKRLIPATIILIFTISLCLYSHISVKRACEQTLQDVDDFRNQSISADVLQKKWQSRKEKMAFFTNHEFLDELSIYIGQLTVYNTPEDTDFSKTQKNIYTVLSMIKDEQKFSAHSFY